MPPDQSIPMPCFPFSRSGACWFFYATCKPEALKPLMIVSAGALRNIPRLKCPRRSASSPAHPGAIGTHNIPLPVRRAMDTCYPTKRRPLVPIAWPSERWHGELFTKNMTVSEQAELPKSRKVKKKFESGVVKEFRSTIDFRPMRCRVSWSSYPCKTIFRVRYCPVRGDPGGYARPRHSLY